MKYRKAGTAKPGIQHLAVFLAIMMTFSFCAPACAEMAELPKPADGVLYGQGPRRNARGMNVLPERFLSCEGNNTV